MSLARYGICVASPVGGTRHDATSRSWSGTGSGRSRMPRTSVNITVAPAMPMASVTIAVT